MTGKRLSYMATVRGGVFAELLYCIRIIRKMSYLVVTVLAVCDLF